ncbi:MAG TPA: phosphoribosylglycinamide formyltransferase [Chloroflexota bacterium]|nr:phosphoribosylglycinamide formyltransferase [Chloroflexota bacterium]
MSRLRLGVLASGRGSSLQALLDAQADPAFPAEVVLVLSNRPSARALERARAAGIPARALPQTRFESRTARDLAYVGLLRKRNVDLVVLAGYDRISDPIFLRAFPGRIINMHPSLLPAFGGESAMAPKPQADALEYGCKIAGCTIQFVVDDGGVDTGPIIAQAAVPVYDDDSVETLVRRILKEEHRLLLDSIRWIAEGRVRLEGRRVYTGHFRPPDEAPATA